MGYTVVRLANLKPAIRNGNPSQAQMRGRIAGLLGLNDAPIYQDLVIDWNPNGDNSPMVKITCEGKNPNEIKAAVT